MRSGRGRSIADFFNKIFSSLFGTKRRHSESDPSGPGKAEVACPGDLSAAEGLDLLSRLADTAKKQEALAACINPEAKATAETFVILHRTFQQWWEATSFEMHSVWKDIETGKAADSTLRGLGMNEEQIIKRLLKRFETSEVKLMCIRDDVQRVSQAFSDAEAAMKATVDRYQDLVAAGKVQKRTTERKLIGRLYKIAKEKGKTLWKR